MKALNTAELTEIMNGSEWEVFGGYPIHAKEEDTELNRASSLKTMSYWHTDTEAPKEVAESNRRFRKQYKKPRIEVLGQYVGTESLWFGEGVIKPHAYIYTLVEA